MTTNAHNLHDPSKDHKGFAKLPTPAELAAMRGLMGADFVPSTGTETDSTRQDAATKKLILGKFQTQEELERSYKELESRLGAQGQEVGQLRQLTDKLLELKKTESGTGNGSRTGPQPVTSDELLRDPRGAIERVVAEQTAGLEAQLAESNKQRIRSEFAQKHPTFESDMQDPDFQAFIKQSQYRMGLAGRTIQGDIGAAHELWGAWEESKGSKSNGKGKTREEVAREQALRDATGMVSGSGGTGTGDGDSSVGGKPIYSRAQIIQMRINDPNGYYDPAFQEMLALAYKEKRVR